MDENKKIKGYKGTNKLVELKTNRRLNILMC